MTTIINQYSKTQVIRLLATAKHSANMKIHKSIIFTQVENLQQNNDLLIESLQKAQKAQNALRDNLILQRKRKSMEKSL